LGHRFTVVYYSNGMAPVPLLRYCLTTLRRAVDDAGGDLVAVTTTPVTHVRCRNLVWAGREQCHRNMYEQILAGIHQRIGTTILLAEHDVLYSAQYLEFMLRSVDERPEMLIYNSNYVILNREGYFLGDREHFVLLSNLGAKAGVLEHALNQKLAEVDGQGMVFSAEPGREEGTDFVKVLSPFPTVDVRHGQNFTGPRSAADGIYKDSYEYWGSASKYRSFFTDPVAPA
jgi:hypothetical protein